MMLRKIIDKAGRSGDDAFFIFASLKKFYFQSIHELRFYDRVLL